MVSEGIASLLDAHPKKLPPGAAQRWFDRGLAMKRGEVHHNLASLLVRLERHEEAVKHAVLALQRGADRDEVRTDKGLAPIRKHPAFAAALKTKR